MNRAPENPWKEPAPVRGGFNVPFPPGYRASGILLHVTSLPSPFGIGDLGPSAYEWVDRLADAGQSWWQVLPLGPTGPSHSPYQALSSFAANPLVISPDRLIKDGLLEPGEADPGPLPSDRVDYEKVIPFKEGLLARSWDRFRSAARPELRAAFEQYREEKSGLQEDAALFMALRGRAGRPFQEWRAELVRREPTALAEARRELAADIERFYFGQFIAFRQWNGLREHAVRRGVQLLGDLPMFVSPDSSDVWADPELFLLDERRNPRVVGGVPPDYFSADGQVWGNPVYDWEAHRRTGYHWWIRRLKARLDYLDAIRIDHFRGFEAAWHVPAGAQTAHSGLWVPGPGAELLNKARQALGGLPLLAEDLGMITPAVEALRDQFQLPGMRVLQFAFDGSPDNPHLPHRIVHNTVVYTGTHDNDTTRAWYDALPEAERGHLWNYLRRPPGEADEAVWELIRLALSSAAALTVIPLQDLLGLRSGARMNIPGRAEGQWVWRFPDDPSRIDAAFRRLHELSEASGRLACRTLTGNLSPERHS